MYRDPRMGSFSDQDFARMIGASQSEYLLMVADNLGSDSSSSSYVNLFGELPYEIENKLNQDYYGRGNKVGNESSNSNYGLEKMRLFGKAVSEDS